VRPLIFFQGLRNGSQGAQSDDLEHSLGCKVLSPVQTAENCCWDQHRTPAYKQERQVVRQTLNSSDG
jgi:hypothetical protein